MKKKCKTTSVQSLFQIHNTNTYLGNTCLGNTLSAQRLMEMHPGVLHLQHLMTHTSEETGATATTNAQEVKAVVGLYIINSFSTPDL